MEEILAAPDTFNVCKENYMLFRKVDKNIINFMVDVLAETPVPGLAEGLGALPRFRAEVGPFIGAMAALRGGTHTGGFAINQNNLGGTGGIEMTMRLGLGLEGVLNEAGDGLVFLDLGFRQ
jgi:hypothetical protein